jgi:hypothetical protein
MTRFTIGRWLVVLLAVAIPSSGHPVTAANEPRLRAMVSASQGQSSAEVRVQAIVQPASENRALDIVVDSGRHYRSSRIELEGAEAPRVHVLLFRSIPPGRYDISVALVGGGGVLATSFGRVVIFD